MSDLLEFKKPTTVGIINAICLTGLAFVFVVFFADNYFIGMQLVHKSVLVSTVFVSSMASAINISVMRSFKEFAFFVMLMSVTIFTNVLVFKYLLPK